MCCKSKTWDPRLYFLSKGSHTQEFYALKKSIDPRPGSNLRTSDPEASTITPRPPGSTHIMMTDEFKHFILFFTCYLPSANVELTTTKCPWVRCL